MQDKFFMPVNFKTRLEELALRRFAQHANREDSALKAASTAIAPIAGYPIAGYWIALIMLASPQARIFFRVHYNTDDIANIGKNIFPQTDGTMKTYEQRLAFTADFMKEYCNLVGGALKLRFEESKIEMGLSLPLTILGFDQLFSIRSNHTRVSHSWIVCCDNYDIKCEVEIDILDPVFLSLVENMKGFEDEGSSEGSLEYL